MLSLNKTPSVNFGMNYEIKNCTKPEMSGNYNNKNVNALNASLLALALLGMSSCANDTQSDIEDTYNSSVARKEMDTKIAINRNCSLDKYLTDLGILKDGNTLGTVKNISFEDMNGATHFLTKGDSTEIDSVKCGVLFNGVKTDADGNKENYDLKFEKHYNGLLVTVEKDNPDYYEGRVDTVYRKTPAGNIVSKLVPASPKDTKMYRICMNTDRKTYTVDDVKRDNGFVLYSELADLKKYNSTLVVTSKDPENEYVEVLKNFQNDIEE